MLIGGGLGLAIWLNGYQSIFTTFALPSVICSIIVASSVLLIMRLIHTNYWFLRLSTEWTSKQPSFWNWANYHYAMSLILPTTLSMVSFATFCLFGTFCSPITINQLYRAIHIYLYFYSRRLCNMTFSAGSLVRHPSIFLGKLCGLMWVSHRSSNRFPVCWSLYLPHPPVFTLPSPPSFLMLYAPQLRTCCLPLPIWPHQSDAWLSMHHNFHTHFRNAYFLLSVLSLALRTGGVWTHTFPY